MATTKKSTVPNPKIIDNTEGIIIDSEFLTLIPELSSTEKTQLELSIKEFGVLSPLVVWKEQNILLDGHHRWEICSKNKIKDYKITYLNFNNKDDAMIWMINNQFGKRNLGNFEKARLALKLEPLWQKKAEENQKSGKEVSEKDKVDTNKELSKIAGVGKDTISKVKKILDAVEKSKNLELKIEDQKVKPDVLMKRLKNNSLTINTVYHEIVKLLKTPEAIKKEEAKEEDKAEILTIRYENVCGFSKDEIHAALKKDSLMMLWVSSENLVKGISYFKKCEYKYKDVFVWNRKENQVTSLVPDIPESSQDSITKVRRPEFLLIGERGKGIISTEMFDSSDYVYTEVPNENNTTPEFFDELIRKHYGNNSIITSIAKKVNVVSIIKNAPEEEQADILDIITLYNNATESEKVEMMAIFQKKAS